MNRHPLRDGIKNSNPAFWVFLSSFSDLVGFTISYALITLTARLFAITPKVKPGENVYGSELARELTGRTDVRPGVQGLFNTVIREVDYEVAKILGLEHLVEPVRALVLAMARRRLARAQEARREAILGEERGVELRGRWARRRVGGEGGSRVVRRLNEFL